MQKWISIVLFFFVIHVSNAQELQDILLAADDASKLTENYIRPVINVMMYSSNSGWATTAKTHKKFGFDITIGASASIVPQTDLIFQFIPSDYRYVSVQNGETSIPTVMGSDDSVTMLDVKVPYNGTDYKVTSFEMPGIITNDLPIDAVPSPMVQLGFGLTSKTDIKLRYVPDLGFDDRVDATFLGLGVQHDLLKYFSPLDKSPLNVSVLAAFTRIDVAYLIEDKDVSDIIAVTGAEAAFKMNAWTVQALGSLDFKMITFYLSFGYNSGSSSMKMKGNYKLTYDVEDNNGNRIGSISETISDPLNLNFDINSYRGTIGTRLNLGLFKIFGDFTLQKYNTVSVGVALSFN